VEAASRRCRSCAPGSALANAAGDAGVAVYAEGFADRSYRADGTLLPRGKPGALIVDTDEVVARALLMAVDQRVIALDGTVVPHPVDSICLHGDTPGAVAWRTRCATPCRGGCGPHALSSSPLRTNQSAPNRWRRARSVRPSPAG
jgi:lactam utilization protein B